MKDHAPDNLPLAYLITIRTYATWLHGDRRGSVDRYHNEYGGPFLQPNPALERQRRVTLKESPYSLADAARREAALNGLLELSASLGWIVFVVHVRLQHLHAVIHATQPPKWIIDRLQEVMTASIRRAGLNVDRRRFWVKKGSCRRLWRLNQLASAIEYVLNGQGRPMTVYDNIKPAYRRLGFY